MGHIACTEPQCLYKGALYLFHIFSILCLSISLKSVLIFSHLCLDLPNDFIPLGFLAKIFYTYLLYPMHATHPAHFIVLMWHL